jgi:hypothetical protein
LAGPVAFVPSFEWNFWIAAHTAGGFGLGGEDRWWWDLSDPKIGAGLGERRITLGTIAEPRKRHSMVGKSENKLRVDGDRVNLRKDVFPALG